MRKEFSTIALHLDDRTLSSTRLRIEGERRAAAFAFKGPGKTGRLTPRKMGKNGDQIQRLSKCPAEVFLIQYWVDMGLIRFGGHLPKGGYDVRNGRITESATTPTLHG